MVRRPLELKSPPLSEVELTASSQQALTVVSGRVKAPTPVDRIAPSEEVQLRILAQDYNQDLASWLRSCCSLNTRDDDTPWDALYHRIRPVVWLDDCEEYKGRRERSQEMKVRELKIRQSPGLPPHWKPKLVVKGWENLIQPPTLRQVIAKGLVEMYEKGNRLKPLPHTFKAQAQLMLKGLGNAQNDPHCFVGPPAPPATEDNIDVGLYNPGCYENKRLSLWFAAPENRNGVKLKESDFIWRDYEARINRNNPTRVFCSQVVDYVNWLRDNTSEQLKRKEIKSHITKLYLTREQKMWRAAVRRYYLGKGTVKQLNAISKHIFDDGRPHIQLNVPRGQVTEKDRECYEKFVTLYIDGKLSPHRLLNLYRRLFPNGRDSKGWETYMCYDDLLDNEVYHPRDWFEENQGPGLVAVGEPQTLYQHSFEAESVRCMRKWHKFSWNYRAIERDDLSFEPTDDVDIRTRDEVRLSEMITSGMLAVDSIKSTVREMFKEHENKLKMEVSLSASLIKDQVIEQIAKNTFIEVPGYKIDPITGIYRPIISS